MEDVVVKRPLDLGVEARAPSCGLCSGICRHSHPRCLENQPATWSARLELLGYTHQEEIGASLHARNQSDRCRKVRGNEAVEQEYWCTTPALIMLLSFWCNYRKGPHAKILSNTVGKMFFEKCLSGEFASDLDVTQVLSDIKADCDFFDGSQDECPCLHQWWAGQRRLQHDLESSQARLFNQLFEISELLHCKSAMRHMRLAIDILARHVDARVEV